LDTLLPLAEVAITMAGFSAVVVILKKCDTNTKLKLDADRFHGMILHAILALLSLLPAVSGHRIR